MRIAILGANSVIALDIMKQLAASKSNLLSLFSRKPHEIKNFIKERKINNNSIEIKKYEEFSDLKNVDLLLNFVGIGDPSKAELIGNKIFDITSFYDNMALDFLYKNPETKYIFISSGAAYGPNNFEQSVCESSFSEFNINFLKSQDWYAISKLHTEAKHRSLKNFKIYDLRIFSYISSSINIDGRFFLSDAIRAIKNDKILETSSSNFYRDFVCPEDLHQLITKILLADVTNDVYDCYSSSCVSKDQILKMLSSKFSLKFRKIDGNPGVQFTGSKDYYYSENKRANEINYIPKFSSLENIEKAFKEILF